MRVIAGACRGKKLVAPCGDATRPTSDRVKEALFSILTSRIDFSDIRVLDICAGTGALGIEALSRGAASCCFVESSRSVQGILEKNITDTGFKAQSTTLFMDVERAVHSVSGLGHRYDLFFLDPPYDSDVYQRVLDSRYVPGLFVPGSIFVAECAARTPLREAYGELKRFDRRVYGDTALEFFALGEM